MSERSIGWLFVAVQAVLLLTLLVLPGRDDFEVPTWLRTAANVVFFAGLAVMLAAAVSLGRALTATPVPNSSGELRTGGLYRFARHPIYSGVILVVMAIATRSGSWPTVAVVGLTLGFFVTKTRWEEQRLRERFPDYADYATRTGRFFPGW